MSTTKTTRPKSKEKPTVPDLVSKTPTSIIGVGASAGGLMAIRRFISELKELPDTAVVIIQHLSLEHVSLMDQLIEGYTDIPVKFAEPGPIESNSIYLNNGTFNIIVRDGHFVSLDRQKSDNNYYFPINLFFTSIAHEYGAHAAGIVLTGTGTDGSTGIVAIKEFGGIVMIQDPESAEFNGMPEAALNQGVHDFVLPLKELGRQVQRMYSGTLSKLKSALISPSSKDETGEQAFERYVRLILLEIKRKLGMNFLSYKNSTIHRRIIKHIFTTNSEDIARYYDLILEDTDELKQLAQGFLIRVTRFFRDYKVWKSIEEQVIPELIERGQSKPLRLFSAACSTGDEAYSMAILLQEAASNAKINIEFKIFATDLDGEALSYANVGIYTKSALEEVPAHLVKKYFNALGDGRYQVVSSLRGKILFAKHDLLKDPTFINVDLVICRNLFIYLKQEEQAALLNKFHFGLKRDSILVLGRTESIAPTAKQLFIPLDENQRIYKKKDTLHRALNFYTENKDVETETAPPKKKQATVVHKSKFMKPTHFGESSQLFMHYSELLLNRVLKPSMIIDEDQNVLFMFGQLDDVVKLPQGIPDSTVNTVIKKSLVTIVKDGVTSALKQKEAIVFDAVSVPESKNDVVSLTFVPDFSPVLDTRVVVMTIESALPMDIVEKAKKVTPDEVEHRKTLVLERELQKTRMSLQSAVEELETTNEELQASNEELLAANEELQSANEELQSVNEELYSVNTEMQEKMVELGNLHSDIDSMIQSTDLGVLFLDSDLKVRKITPRAMDHFNFTPSDEGREINDFTKNFELPSLMDDITKCRNEVITIEHKVFNTKLKTEFILRISPYRRNVMNKQVIEGAVLAFIDMTPEFTNN